MNLTIMIATKNRPNFLARAIKYYSIAGFTGYILIGDSSSEENSKKNLNIIDTYNELKINYHKDIQLSADQMVSYLSKKVETNYSVMINDDDILIVSSIHNCINFLEKNLDFSAVNGRGYNIGLNQDDCIPFGKITSIQKYPLTSYQNEDALKRISDFFYKTLNVNMSITRSEINIRAFNNVEKLNKFDSAFVFGELLHAVTVLINGKIANVDDCYLVRQKHSQQYYKKVNKYDWLKQSNLVSAIFELQKIIKAELFQKNEKLNQKLENQINNLILIKVKYIFKRFLKQDMILISLLKKIIKDLIKVKRLIKSYFINPTNEFFYKKSRIFFEDMNKLRQYFNLVEKK
jgi:glycosyltransferase domain-containing protein